MNQAAQNSSVKGKKMCLRLYFLVCACVCQRCRHRQVFALCDCYLYTVIWGKTMRTWQRQCGDKVACVAIRWFLQKTKRKAQQIKQMPSCVINIQHIAAFFCRLERICWRIQLNICSCLHTCDNVTEVSLRGMYSSRAQHSAAYFWCAFPYCPTKCSSQTSVFVCIRAVVGETYPLTYFPLCIYSVAGIFGAPRVGVGPIWHLCFMPS